MCKYNKHCTAGCNKCQPLNQSNKTVVIPVSGQSAYETWKSYNPDSTWSESEWLENYVKVNNNYENFEI